MPVYQTRAQRFLPHHSAPMKPQPSPPLDRPTVYSVKHEDQWFWKSNLTSEEVEEQLRCGAIDDDWLICPVGKAYCARTVGEFRENANVFVSRSLVRVTPPWLSNTPSMATRNAGIFIGLGNVILGATLYGVNDLSIAAVGLGLILFQWGLLATWGVFSSGPPVRRTATAAGIGLCWLVTFMVGNNLVRATVFFNSLPFLLVICTATMLTIQLPLYVAKHWFRIRLHASRGGAVQDNSRIGVGHLLAAMTAVALTLALLRIALATQLPFDDSDAMQSAMVLLAFVATWSALYFTPYLLATAWGNDPFKRLLRSGIWYVIMTVLLTVAHSLRMLPGGLQLPLLSTTAFAISFAAAAELTRRHGFYLARAIHSR